MLRIALFVGYLLVLLADLAGLGWGIPILHQVAKPMLMPLLMVLVYANKRTTQQQNWKLVLIALAFSWVGDILLLLESFMPVLFIPGLLSFLLAHLFYIGYFRKYRLATLPNWHRKNLPVTLVVIAWSAGLFIFLSPSLGTLLIPVAAYCLVITLMLLMALALQHTTPQPVYRQLVWGAVLFVISDSVLAVNRFAFPFAHAGVLVMLTYGLAQLMLTLGAVSNRDIKIR